MRSYLNSDMAKRQVRLRDVLTTEFAGTWGRDPSPLRPATTVLRSTDIDDEGSASTKTGAKRDISPKDVRSKRLLPGDILLETSGGGPGRPVGRVAYFTGGKGDFVTSNFIRTLRVNRSVDSHFLMHCLLHEYSQPSIGRYQQQTTGIINLNYKDYLNHLLEVPDLDEQHRVSEIIDLLNRQVQKTEKLCSKLELTRIGMLNDLFTYGLQQDGTLRNGVDLSHSAPIAPMPHEWNIRSAGNLFAIQLGKMLDTKHFGNGPRFFYLTNRNVQWGKINLKKLESMPFKSPERKKFSIIDGDVLMCEGGEVGRCAVWQHGVRAIYYQKALHRLRTKGAIYPEFFVAYMEWVISRNGLAAWVGRTSIAHFPLGKLLAFPVRVPSRDEQQRIVAILTAIKQEQLVNAAILEKLKALRQGLSTDLLTGRVRVPLKAAGDRGR